MLLIFFLQEFPKSSLPPLRELLQHLLPLIPLIPLDEGVALEDLLYCLPDSFASIHQAEDPFLYVEPYVLLYFFYFIIKLMSSLKLLFI